MPRRELKFPVQVEDWLVELGSSITKPGSMILIGSGALLWHAAQRGITDAIIGSEFERTHGWHVNLMPDSVLKEFPPDWRKRASSRQYEHLNLEVPSPPDLLIPKYKRGEPRDRVQAAWAKRIGLLV